MSDNLGAQSTDGLEAAIAAASGRVEGRVWYCEDDCDCSQAYVEDVTPNPKVPGWVLRRELWHGSFFTEGQSGAYDELEAVVTMLSDRGIRLDNC